MGGLGGMGGMGGIGGTGGAGGSGGGVRMPQHGSLSATHVPNRRLDFSAAQPHASASASASSASSASSANSASSHRGMGLGGLGGHLGHRLAGRRGGRDKSANLQRRFSMQVMSHMKRRWLKGALQLLTYNASVQRRLRLCLQAGMHHYIIGIAARALRAWHTNARRAVRRKRKHTRFLLRVCLTGWKSYLTEQRRTDAQVCMSYVTCITIIVTLIHHIHTKYILTTPIHMIQAVGLANLGLRVAVRWQTHLLRRWSARSRTSARLRRCGGFVVQQVGYTV
jgi:hypothetical protein